MPTPQAVFDAAPSTNIKEEDDDGDRAALLPELNRALTAVNNILGQLVSPSSDDTQESTNRPQSNSTPHSNDLPWLTSAFPSDGSESAVATSETQNVTGEPSYTRRELGALAPLLDRLGRALTDAAPHVAALAASLPTEETPSDRARDPDADNVVIAGESIEEPAPSEPSRLSSTGSGLFSLLSRDSRLRTSAVSRNTSSSRLSAHMDDSIREQSESSTDIDPDYVDFVNGMVNTTRGDPRSGGRRGSADDGVSLLGAYLALSSLASEGASDDNNENGGGGLGGLGRLLRERGSNGGGGIDIHIHAVVTGPGVGPPGALGMAMMGGGPTMMAGPPPTVAPTTPRGGFFSGVGRRGGGGSDQIHDTPVSNADEDDNIFADLYSENPDPIDPHGSPPSGHSDGTAGNHQEEVAETDEEFTSRVAYGESRSGLAVSSHEARSPSRLSSFSSQRSGRSGNSPRRGSTIGRVFRRVLGQGRRSSSHHDSDSDLP